MHDHGNGRFVYEPQLTDAYADFEQGVEDHRNVVVTSDGLRLHEQGSGVAVFDVRSPYIIVPQVGELDRREDDTEAAILEWSGRQVSWSISTDNGLTWLPVATKEPQTNDDALAAIDLTRWVSGRYGYSLRCDAERQRGRRPLAPTEDHHLGATRPGIAPCAPGCNAMRLVTGDHYGLPTRVVEVRSRASSREELEKYLVAARRTTTPRTTRGSAGPSPSE